jgi:hypothetical protein
LDFTLFDRARAVVGPAEICGCLRGESPDGGATPGGHTPPLNIAHYNRVQAVKPSTGRAVGLSMGVSRIARRHGIDRVTGLNIAHYHCVRAVLTTAGRESVLPTNHRTGARLPGEHHRAESRSVEVSRTGETVCRVPGCRVVLDVGPHRVTLLLAFARDGQVTTPCNVTRVVDCLVRVLGHARGSMGLVASMG